MRKTSTRPSARDRILTAASDLFYREGVNKVGIDRIIAESGVAKMSLYNNFKSKDDLIAAYLEQFDQTWGPAFRGKVEALANKPEEQLLAIFDVIHKWFQQPNFRGCRFVNASVELANPDHPATQVAMRHKRMLVAYIRELAEAAGLKKSESLTHQLAILIEGAIVVALMGQREKAALYAKEAATVLIAAHQA